MIRGYTILGDMDVTLLTKDIPIQGLDEDRFESYLNEMDSNVQLLRTATEKALSIRSQIARAY